MKKTKLLAFYSIFFIIGNPSFSQFNEDFSGYINQAAADAVWITNNNSFLFADANNDNLFFDAPRTGGNNAIMYHDMGSNLSDTQWVLRFQLDVTQQNNAWNLSEIWFGISSNNTSSYSTDNDFIGIYFRSKSEGPPQNYYSTQYQDNCPFSGQPCTGTDNRVIFTHTTTVETVWVEIIRLSATSFSVELFSDANYTTSIQQRTETALPSSVVNLRYLKIATSDQNNSTGSIVLKGTIDDIQVCDNTTTFTCPLLPIELLSFSVNWKDESHETALIEWQTANETNNDYFEIQRSIDGVNFNTIMQVDGAGTTIQTINYEELDTEPYQDGTSYYRLKQMDFDGTFSYSQVEVLSIHEGLEIINLFPNPVYNNLHFSLFSSLNTEINFNIYNPLGQIVQTESMQINVGVSNIDLDAQKLVNGNYYLEIITSDKQYVTQRKFVVEKEN